MKPLSISLLCLLSAVVFLACTASAQMAAPSSGSDYMSGGISSEERAQMESMAGGYNLKLVFTTPDGAYLSDVGVRIQSAGNRNTYVDALSNGPWFYVNLPGGLYEVTASYEGAVQTVPATVTPGKLETIYIRFNP